MYIDRVWKDGNPSGDISPASLVYHAKQFGWSGNPIAADGGNIQGNLRTIPNIESVLGTNFNPPKAKSGRNEVSEPAVKAALRAVINMDKPSISEIVESDYFAWGRTTAWRAMRYLKEKSLVRSERDGRAQRYDINQSQDNELSGS